MPARWVLYVNGYPAFMADSLAEAQQKAKALASMFKKPVEIRSSSYEKDKLVFRVLPESSK